jgi:hypothetical protein
MTSELYFLVEVCIELHGSPVNYDLQPKKQMWLEEAGIDPAASPLLTKRSTI